MNPMEKVISKDGTTIAFDKAGQGPALIMVDAAGNFHGFRPMGPLAELLASEFTVFTYDRRGRGESSDTLPYAVEREIEDLQALIDTAGGPAFVYGFSSGAVLGLRGAMHGLAIKKLGLLEPPILFEAPPPDEPDLGAEIAALVAAGRRGDAFEHFVASIGVPAEMIAELRQAPVWPQLEALAHTLVYDTIVTSAFPVERLAALSTPALVLASEGSDGRLINWARGLADRLPNGSLRTMKGEWHGIPVEDLAPVLVAFFKAGER
jgi:pimeloyl-ACP methyl ester carboxylesterase